MKKNILIIICIIVIITPIYALKNKSKIVSTSSFDYINDIKKYYNPSYNTEYITDINTIKLNSDKIKNKYQFVIASDLHASIRDDLEKDEKIRQALLERNDMFTQQHPNKIDSQQVFEEIINFTNNKNADALLLAGDIIDSPSDSNFRFLRENLKKINSQYLYTLGNHDWSFAWDYHTKNAQEKYFPKFNEFMNDIQVSYLEYEDLIVLAINDSKDLIEDAAIDKIKQVLEKKKPTIVMLHVPLATEYIAKKAIEIRNRVSAIGEHGIKPTESTKKAIDLILSENYNVFHVISGHVHFEIEDELKKNITQTVSAPAYAGNLSVIEINN
ncbi:MAG: metallophosphoesterase [Clostridia bacterium]|nr:metallophosphoesterase [Clostridia bacterium]